MIIAKMLKKVLVLSVLAALAIFTNGDPVALDGMIVIIHYLDYI